MDRLTINNFGENGYTALHENEKYISNKASIHNIVFHPFSGSKIKIEKNNTLRNDPLTKFYIISISFLGLYVFHKLFFPVK